MLAHATERTLIVTSHLKIYNDLKDKFLPLSENCTSVEGISNSTWDFGNHSAQVIYLPYWFHPNPSFAPQAISAEFESQIRRFHGRPGVWWAGQFFKYILRPQPETVQTLEAAKKKLGFRKPIVGVHIRRTDKLISEAQFHNVSEYMRWVDDYYDQLETLEKVEKRRVFMASDDPSVFEEARKAYPHYEVIGDPDVARSADVKSRDSNTSIHGIILDFHLLSQTDYLVCTFSSNVCRLAYEIMQTFFTDASHRVKSLDDVYWYYLQTEHYSEAVVAHRPKNKGEITMEIGDVIKVNSNHWDGYSIGMNKRTNETGAFPSFKVVDAVEVVDYTNITQKRVAND